MHKAYARYNTRTTWERVKKLLAERRANEIDAEDKATADAWERNQARWARPAQAVSAADLYTPFNSQYL
jgi:hypothetical protein